MRIGSWDTDDRVLVVAEVGNNHEGDLGLATAMVGLAADAGADAVKFQTMTPERLVAPDQQARLEQLGKFCLPYDAWERLHAAAETAGVLFLSTPFDVSAVSILDPLVPAFKIASGDNDVVPLLRAVANTGKPIILSTGLADLDAVRRSVSVIEKVWEQAGARPGLALLHCVVSYPAPREHAALGEIPRLAELADTVGYSDHTMGTEAAVLAVALGARIIEKHFTISNDHSDFRDHALSADPDELRLLVERIRATEQAIRPAGERPMACEEPAVLAARRSLRAARSLPAGHTVGEDDIAWLRPADGLPASDYDQVVGRTLAGPVEQGSLLRPEDFE